MQPTVGKPDRTLVVIIAIVVVIALLALIVIFTRGAPSTVDPASPEGVVQEYTQAFMSGDRTKALSLITSDIRDSCERTEPIMTENIRMTVVSTTTTADTSVVRVMISHGSGNNPFGGSGYESDETFSLKRAGGSWSISSTPWELMVCYNQMGSK